MKGDPLKANVLASRVISNVSDDLVKALKL